MEMERSWAVWLSLKLIPLYLVKVAHLTGRMQRSEIDRSRVGVKYTRGSRPPGGSCSCVRPCMKTWHRAGSTHHWRLEVKRGAITPITSTAQIRGAFLKRPPTQLSPRPLLKTPIISCPSQESTPETEPHMSSTHQLACPLLRMEIPS